MDLVGLDDDYEDEIVKIFVSWQVREITIVKFLDYNCQVFWLQLSSFLITIVKFLDYNCQVFWLQVSSF